MEGQIRAPKEIERARGTHFLEKVDGERSQEGEKSAWTKGTHFLESEEGKKAQESKKRRASEGHPQTEEHKRGDKSEHRK